jgi:hypothetical protein
LAEAQLVKKPDTERPKLFGVADKAAAVGHLPGLNPFATSR